MTMALKRPALARLRRVLPSGDELAARNTPLPLRTELFLIAHDDDSGHRHVNQAALELGLAGAVLLELWIANRIRIGWRDDARNGRCVSDPGRITVLDTTPIGDPLSDSALATLWHTGGVVRINEFVKQFAATGLYERVRADMIAAGVIHRTTRRRFLLFRAETHKPTRKTYPVRARARIRSMVDQYRHEANPGRPSRRTLALSGLVTALELTRHLYPSNLPAKGLHAWLSHIVNEQNDQTIRDVAAVITN